MAWMQAPRHRLSALGALGSGVRWLSSNVVPVVIAGAGPTGLTLSCYLSKYGVPHVVYERSSALTTHPQAHFINHRTMEVFRPLWGLADEVSAASPPLDHWRRFLYCESMAGPPSGVLASCDHFPGQTSPHQPHLSPEALAHVPQSVLLPMLASRAAGQAATASLRFGHTIGDVVQDDQGVTVCVREPSGRSTSVRCAYLVAADGANSGLRTQLAVPMEGQPALQHLINIHFTSPPLASALLKQPQRAAMLYFVFNARLVAVVVAHRLTAADGITPVGEFVAQVPYFPPLQDPETDFPARPTCEQLVAAAAGLPLHALQPLTIHTVRPWTMSAQVAATFRAGRRVLLAGDAAHRFPPAGGFGLNSGVQDAHNLAWKLAAVLTQTRSADGTATDSRHTGTREQLFAAGSSGWIRGSSSAGGSGDTVAPNRQQRWSVDAARLLDSYDGERRPVAQGYTDLSVANWEQALRVPRLLGLDPGAAELLRRTTAGLPLPRKLSAALLAGGLGLGRSAAAALASSGLRSSALAELVSSGQSLRLQFPAHDLGFSYSGPMAAVVPPGQQAAACTQSQVSSHASRGVAEPGAAADGGGYQPSCSLGHRFPHVQLLPAADALAGQGRPPPQTPTCSSLDVIAANATSGCLTLVVVCGGEDTMRQCCAWASAGVQLAVQLGAPLCVSRLQGLVVPANQGGASCCRAAACSQQQQQQQQHSALAATAATTDATFKVLQPSEAVIREMSPGSAFLVRPDGHIAWRRQQTGEAETEGVAATYFSHAAALEAAIKHVLFIPDKGSTAAA